MMVKRLDDEVVEILHDIFQLCLYLSNCCYVACQPDLYRRWGRAIQSEAEAVIFLKVMAVTAHELAVGRLLYLMVVALDE